MIASPAGRLLQGRREAGHPLAVARRTPAPAAAAWARPRRGGNYAASLAAQREAIEHGCDQVVFLDASEHRYVEELGGMNLFFVHADGRVVTPD